MINIFTIFGMINLVWGIIDLLTDCDEYTFVPFVIGVVLILCGMLVAIYEEVLEIRKELKILRNGEEANNETD